MPKAASPKPVIVTTICSMCGLGWELHGEDPTTEDCIRLLKAELARRPVTYPIARPVPYPYPVPYPKPYPYPWGPTWHGNGMRTQETLSFNTPRVIESTCKAVTT